MAEKKTILVVDDKEDIRNTVKEVLEKNNFNVLLAVNGEDGIKKLKQSKIDLIILDIMMPGIPSKDVVKEADSIKIIYLSGVGISSSEKKELTKKNVVGFIEKPFNTDDLIKKLKKATRKKWILW